VDERQRNCDRVQQAGHLSLEVVAHGGLESRTRTLLGDDRLLKNGVGDCGGEQHASVNRRGQLGEMILAHPRRRERDDRQPEEQVEVRPQNGTVDPRGELEHVVMIAPIDAEEDEAQNVA
jgi:hypothetical protein